MGTGWDVAANFVNLLSRFPFERLFDRGPNDKALDALESRLKEKGLLRRNRRFGNQPLAKLPFRLPPPLPTIAKEDEVKRGTTATIWSDEHVTQAISDLTKALRMACSRGVKDAQVRKRLKGACSELAWAVSAQGKGGDCLWVSADKDSHRGCSNISDPLSVNKRGFCSLNESLDCWDQGHSATIFCSSATVIATPPLLFRNLLQIDLLGRGTVSVVTCLHSR